MIKPDKKHEAANELMNYIDARSQAYLFTYGEE